MPNNDEPGALFTLAVGGLGWAGVVLLKFVIAGGVLALLAAI